MILPITLTIAGAAALLHIWLASRVSRLRRQFSVSVGDGGNEPLLRRIRAHANYAENMPIFVILLALLELAGGDRRILWGLGIAFILARILHAFGMDQPSPSRLRLVGMVASTLLIIGAAGWALSYAYRAPVDLGNEVEIGPGRSADLLPPPRG
jgi:uncharacterized membrane protein YecN with MAPEG domain